MKFNSAIAALTAAIWLAGCASTGIGLHATNSPSPGSSAPAPGSAYSSAGIRAELRPNAYFGLLVLGFIAAGIHDHYLHWSHGSVWRAPPQLDEDRAIAERDCSRPIEATSANLRCK